jgi:hypothetical protein
MTLVYTYRLSRSVPPNMLHNDPNPQDAPCRSQPHGRHPPPDRLRVIPIPGLRSMRMMMMVMMLVLVLVFVEVLKVRIGDITLDGIARCGSRYRAGGTGTKRSHAAASADAGIRAGGGRGGEVLGVRVGVCGLDWWESRVWVTVGVGVGVGLGIGVGLTIIVSSRIRRGLLVGSAVAASSCDARGRSGDIRVEGRRCPLPLASSTSVRRSIGTSDRMSRSFHSPRSGEEVGEVN